MSDFTQWLGKTETRLDSINLDHAKRVAATLGECAPEAGAGLPHLWHWAFFQEAVPAAEISADGHAKTGNFLPEVRDRIRMWAGGRLSFIKPLIVGMPAERVSTILDITEKSGRTGSLLFVTVKHDYHQDGQLIISEEQDIVYRQPSVPSRRESADDQIAEWEEPAAIDPVTLFRYSAVTFNGHRIHYDWRYVTETEGYAGLVIHGPLTATLVLRAFTHAKPNAKVRAFSFKGVQPLIEGDDVRLKGKIVEPGKASVWASSQFGVGQIGTVDFD